jgi:hypothetical protein
MSIDFSTLVTDRTGADFERWEYLRNKGYSNMTTSERAEWLAGMKGSYNATDLNRVGEALNYLCDKLTEASYITHQTTFTARTNWQRTDVVTKQEFGHYLNCVSVIREAMSRYDTTPRTPTDNTALSYEEANNIEQILVDVETLLENMLASRFYCGDVFSGEI